VGSKEKQVAYCGIVCNECPIFIVTVDDDNEKRKEMAQRWQKESGVKIRPEDINCDGCLSDTGIIIEYGVNCEIRKCGEEKQVRNCAYCENYICDKLYKFYKRAQKASIYKATLDEIKASLGR